MNSFSQLVLLWLFGRWIFEDGEIASNVGQQVVTPLTIFASAFSTLGLAMFGILASWAMFLGIFRLKNNGNFLGARDGNESFFYPLRIILALVLCAPVIPVAAPGGNPITLTPGHSLVAGIAKSATEFGDYMQRHAFELMHDANLFNDPQFRVKVDREAVLAMLKTWNQPTAKLATAAVWSDPDDVLAEESIDSVALEALKMRWNLANADNQVALTMQQPAIDWLTRRLASIEVPLIAPTDEMAASLSSGIGSIVDASAAEGTAAREMATEGFICRNSDQGGWMNSTFCSDEYFSVKKNNAASIETAIASAQREIWTGMVRSAHAQAMTTLDGSMTAQAYNKIAHDAAQYLPKAAAWYSETIQNHIKNTLASDQSERADVYFDEVQNWGWMLGGTFVLRAASDFSRAASYAEGATALMMPTTNISALTSGDDLSKMVEQQIMTQQAASAGPSAKSFAFEFFNLDALMGAIGPGAQNIHNVANWGRWMVGTGIGVWATGKSGIVDKIPVVRGMVDSPVVKSIGVVMILAGGMIGYVMPLLFAVHGLMGAISWLVAVATTFFGITLWSAGMAAPKGEEHTSQLSAKGYNSLIFIALYPALAVGGLAAAIVISAVGLSLVMMFGLGLFGMFDPGTAEAGRPLESLGKVLVGGTFLVFVMVIVSWNVVATSAQLITAFPRTVLNMIALSEPGLNPYESGVQNLTGGLSASARQLMTSSVGGVVTRHLSRATDIGPGAGGR